MGIVDLLALSLRERQGKRVDDDNLERIDEPAIVASHLIESPICSLC